MIHFLHEKLLCSIALISIHPVTSHGSSLFSVSCPPSAALVRSSIRPFTFQGPSDPRELHSIRIRGLKHHSSSHLSRVLWSFVRSTPSTSSLSGDGQTLFINGASNKSIPVPTLLCGLLQNATASWRSPENSNIMETVVFASSVSCLPSCLYYVKFNLDVSDRTQLINHIRKEHIAQYYRALFYA